MNTRFRTTSLLAMALGAVLATSNVSAGGGAAQFQEKSRGQAEGRTAAHAPRQPRQPQQVRREAEPRGSFVAHNGNGNRNSANGQVNVPHVAVPNRQGNAWQGSAPVSRGASNGGRDAWNNRGNQGSPNASTGGNASHGGNAPAGNKSNGGKSWNGGNWNAGNNHGGSYDHHTYRPPRVVTTLPTGYRHYTWHGSPYYQHAGLWYRPYGTRYVVTGAPYGLFVSYLPGYYSSFWFGSTRYYYSDNTYYLYEPAQHGYVVTHSPYTSEQSAGDEQQADTQDEDLYIYPAQGQSEQQQADDRYECHSWGTQQSGYDPIDSDYDADRRADYLRAMTACLTGRGYSVR